MTTQHPTDGLSRQRLRFAAVGGTDTHICSIVAPAGFGKSTLCRQILGLHDGPVASVTAGSHLLAGSLIEQVDAQLARNQHDHSRPSLVGIDDSHLLEGSPVAADLVEIVGRVGPMFNVVLAGRLAPPVDLQPFRLENRLCELDAEDLRFRSWEVEELFTTIYGVRLPPSELAVLAAATEGWAAGLQLYRHAIKRSSPSTRLHQLKLLSQSRLATVRTYLSMNVLDGLDEPLRTFALQSSILGHMDPKACNRFLGRTDSERCLKRLVEMQLFTTCSDDGVYRYHEVFRSFLEGELITATEPEKLNELYLWAGRLLEEGNATADAIRAYTMAGSEDAVARLLGELQSWPNRPWVDAIPDGLLADPRLRLARARMLIRAGRPSEALAELMTLAENSKFTEVQQAALQDANRLRRWTDPQRRPVDPNDWTSLVHATIAGRDHAPAPGSSFTPSFTQGPAGGSTTLVAAITSFLRGEPLEAARLFDALDHARLGQGETFVAGAFTALNWWLIDGVDPSETLSHLRDEADRNQLGWITRVLRSLLIGFPESDDPAPAEKLKRLDEEADRADDRWSPAIARLAVLIGSTANESLRDSDSLLAEANSAIPRLRTLGADGLAVWAVMARTLLATAPDGRPSCPPGPPIEDLSWIGAVPGKLSARLRSPFSAGLESGDAAHAFMRVLRDESICPQPTSSVSAPPTMSVRLFGAFEIVIGGVPVPLGDLRPRARSVLRYLALHAGSPVHRESILEAMWPDTDPVTAGKRLHVAISAIRHQLGTAGPALIRTAETYQIGGAAWPVLTDLEDFDRAVNELRSTVGQDPSNARVDAAQRVLSLYAGELLLEEGPSTWAVRERDERQHAYLAALCHLAVVRSSKNDWDAAIGLCRQGLRVDRYQDELWRLLLTALELAGRSVDLERAKLDYEALLLEMSIPVGGEPGRRTSRPEPLPLGHER